MKFNLFYEITTFFVRSYSRIMLQMDIKRNPSLPAGPKIYVANHPSASDGFLIHWIDKINLLIVDSAFAIPMFGKWIRRAGQVPVAPGGDALEQAEQLLRDGNSVGVFPEGTYSPQTGGFGKPHSGAARIALKTGVPVIPVGIFLLRDRNVRIAGKIRNRNTLGYWYLYGPYFMTVGEPICFTGDAEDFECVDWATNTIMEHIKALAHESELRYRARAVPKKNGRVYSALEKE